jgi:hypothetical protein
MKNGVFWDVTPCGSCNIPKDTILHSHHRENLKSYNIRYNSEANSEIHNVNTSTKYDFHQPLSQLSFFQKGVYYAGIKVFNGLPVSIRELSPNTKQLKFKLKTFHVAIHFIHWMNILIIRIHPSNASDVYGCTNRSFSNVV